jgi:adenine-specific DNA methylase
MPNKTEEYLALACKTADSFSRQWEHWAEFLITAARLYKYSYPDQLMIYAQRPDATACAEYDVWNNKMNRYVRRGSKGIALLDESGGYPRLHYVFDVSDTAPRRNALYPDLWQINDSLKEPVRSMLAENYGVHSESFGQQLADVAGKLVQFYWDNNSSDILGIVDGSYLMSYDDAGRELQFKSAAAMGVTYMLLERCGLDPAGWFDEKDFQAVYDFTTPSAVYALGTAVSDCSREVLRQIERTVKTTIRRRNIERSQEEYEQQSELHEDRRLFSAEPDLESAPEAAEPVRQDAPELSDGAAPGGVQHDAAERDPVPAPVGGGTDGRKQDATADERTVGEKPGSGQGEKTDGVGAAHEQPESAGGGNDPDRADLQLSFLEAAIPTEAQQIESIDQAESEKSSSAFVLSQADIEKALRRGSNFENSKLRIWEIYQTQPDRKLRAKALAKEYAPHGPGGCSHTYLDGSSGWLDHDSKGLTFEHYPDHQKIFLRWNQVEKYIDLMMQADRYLTDKEKNAIELYFELNADSAAEYNALKKQYPDALVGFEQNGQFEFYGEDARKICELTGGKLLERETALGTVLVTGFPREQWVYRAKQLWECGENIYLAGLNEDGTHHQTKYLRREDYLPVGSIVHMEGRKFRVDKVDFDKDSVTLQDMALAELRMPIFREAPLAVVRELYEQEPEPPVLGSDGLGLPGEDSNKLPVSIEANEVPTTPEAAAAEEGLNEEGAPELAGNFRITDEELGAGGPKQKFARNIKAIKTLFTLEQEHRGATAEEQQVLSQYVGWGGLADAFDPDKSSWAKEYAELKGLLSEEEYKAARGSVLNAHYTSPTVIRAIYDAVERMGFRTGNILEPSMGVGNFFGMLPESMADSRLYGVELDSITGRIAQKLYPEANIKVAGFETTDRRDFYDLAVGNVPFGNYKVNDKAYNKLNFSIHNYFFAKAIDQVRPGGIVAFVTSRYTLDSKDSAARKHIAERADLLGAIRLPNNAFRANAGTDVVSDIIFLQKRDRPMDHEPAWVQLGKTEDGISINSYFADHPEMILGKLTTENTQYGKEEATVVPIEGANLADQLREAVRQLEGQYLEAAAEVPDIAETEAERRTLPADPDVKNFSYPQGAGSAHRDRGGAGERTD